MTWNSKNLLKTIDQPI